MDRQGTTVFWRSFRITSRGVYLCGEANLQKEAGANATSPQATRGEVLIRLESQGYNPKPLDLILSMVKWG
jgi:hypothetical protein